MTSNEAADDQALGAEREPQFIKDWIAQFEKDSVDPHSEVSGWFSAESARLELDVIQRTDDEATRRTAEAALAARVALHVGLKERQLAQAIQEASRDVQQAVTRATNRVQVWLIILTGLLVIVGIMQVWATFASAA